MADFCTLDELRSYIAQTGQTPNPSIDDPYLQLAADAATTALQTACNRTFEATTAAATRTFTFRPSGSPYGTSGDYYGNIDWSVIYPTLYNSLPPQLEVDDYFLDVQTIGQITVTDYITAGMYTPTRGWPYNAASKGEAFTRLEFALGTRLPTGQGQLLVNAKWGWSAIPSTIKNACLLQASRYYARRTSPMGVAGIGDMGQAIRLQARLDPDVAQMVNNFNRYWAVA